MTVQQTSATYVKVQNKCLNVVCFCHLIIVSQKDFDLHLLVSEKLISREEIGLCAHCSTVLKMFWKQSIMEVMPTSKCLMSACYCINIGILTYNFTCSLFHTLSCYRSSACCFMHTLKNLCFKVHLYTYIPWT